MSFSLLILPLCDWTTVAVCVWASIVCEEEQPLRFKRGKLFLVLSIVINGGVLRITECHKYLVDLFSLWRNGVLRY